MRICDLLGLWGVEKANKKLSYGATKIDKLKQVGMNINKQKGKIEVLEMSYK